jgi:hypothetical protein
VLALGQRGAEADDPLPEPPVADILDKPFA